MILVVKFQTSNKTTLSFRGMVLLRVNVLLGWLRMESNPLRMPRDNHTIDVPKLPASSTTNFLNFGERK